MSIRIRDDLRGLHAYGAPQLDVPVRLNVNENPYPPSPALVAAIAASAANASAGLNRYPDRDFPALRGALADYLLRDSGERVPIEQVWAANGSNEVMHHLLSAFGGPGRTAVSFGPTYSMYPEYARDTFTAYVELPRADDFTVSTDAALSALGSIRPDLVLLASPNNPTGTALPLEVVDAIASAVDGLVIVDEAYAEFRRPGTPTALALLGRHANLVVTRTMSKAFALAGARVGYFAAGDPAVVDAVRIVRLPYHLSAVTQAVASTALAHADELLAGVARIRDERDRLVAWLREQDLEVAESDANFVLFGRFSDRHAIWQGLLDGGVLIRETGPQGWLRASIGTPEENEAFRRALLAALGRQEESA